MLEKKTVKALLYNKKPAKDEKRKRSPFVGLRPKIRFRQKERK
jgi:hypothetical protein